MNKRTILSVLIALLVILSTVISKWIFQIPMVGVVTIIEIGLYGISVSVVCYRFIYAIGINALTGFLQGLFVGMIISIATFILLKFDIKKSILLIEENKWIS